MLSLHASHIPLSPGYGGADPSTMVSSTGVPLLLRLELLRGAAMRQRGADPARQAVERDRSKTWVTLRHDAEALLEITFVLSEGWVNFYDVMAHDGACSVGSEPTDSSR